MQIFNVTLRSVTKSSRDLSLACELEGSGSDGKFSGVSFPFPGAPEGSEAVVLIENREGSLWLVVWDDPSSEDPIHEIKLTNR